MHAGVLQKRPQQLLREPLCLAPVALVERGDSLVVELNLFGHGYA